MRTYSLGLKVAACITLAFYAWTFGWLFEIPAAYAASKSSAKKEQKAAGSGQARQKTIEEKFQESLDRMREAGDDRAKLTAERNEIETLDVELRKQFQETEAKIKDLPEAIKQRHRDFTKKYAENMAALKTNMTDVESAKTADEVRVAAGKVKAFLDKTKAPSRHQKLDPENLPFRARKAAKLREPRLKKEEFERDFPKQKSQGGQKVADSRFLPDLLPRRVQPKPVQLAFNGPVSDVPFSLGLPLPSGDRIGSVPEWFNRGMGGGSDIPQSALRNPQLTAPQFAFIDSTPFLLAQATSQPTADDLAETPEIQFTDAIRAKAQELGCAPAKLFAWTRNSIEFTPSYGSIQGADMCLQTKQCNAIDTNALLAALMRSCNIPVRLNIGTVEIPIEKVMNWAGGFSDPTAALNYIASGGIPVTGLRSGGKIYAARLETAWLRVFVDYIPSFGAVHKEGDTFIPLDASYKQFSYSDGVDFQTTVPFDGQSLADQIKATATINEQESYVTNVDSTLIQTALNDYNAQLDNYVTQNLPNATPGDILGKKEIIKKEQPILPASLPYKVVVAGAEVTEIPDSLRHKVTVQLSNADSFGDNVFTYTTSLPQLAGKRLTISYEPATTADQDTINRYVEAYATSIPAYLVQFKPVLKIENTTVATGASVGMGSAQDLNISLTSPRGTELMTHNLLAGDYTAIGINPSAVSLEVLQNRVDKNDFSEPVGEMLHQTALSYWAEADAFNGVIAKTLRVNNLRHPSELAVSAKVSVSYVWGVPNSATYNKRNMDVKLDSQSVSGKTTDKMKEFNYMQQSGINSSFLEGAIFDQLFGVNIGDSISAVTALKTANDQGIPIYRISSSNIAVNLPKLQIEETIKSEISNAVSAGLTVQISQTNITKSGWTGVGYVIFNSTDGSGAYRISGGLNGSDSSTSGRTVVPAPTAPSQQTFDALMCFVGSFSIIPLAALSYAGFAQIPTWLAVFSPLGFVGMLIILAAVIFTLILIAALALYINSCINVITSINTRDETMQLACETKMERGKKWKNSLQNSA